MNRPSGWVSPLAIRPRLMLEAVSEMVAQPDWSYMRSRLTIDDQTGAHEEAFSFVGTQDPAVIAEVVRGDVHVSMLNPSAMLTLAARGTGPFSEPQPIAPIGIIPSYDQLAFAVSPESGVTSLDQIREDKVPLRISVRGSADPATSLLVNEVLRAHGFGFEDIERWGGHVSYDQALPNDPTRLGAIERGELDAVCEEAVNSWVNRAAEMGMRFLPVSGEPLKRLTDQGFRAASLQTSRFPELSEDVPTIDFSGWPIYTAARAPDHLITAFCWALEARKDRITWDPRETSPLPLERMCNDADDAPLEVPLHPAAERVWRELGYLH